MCEVVWLQNHDKGGQSMHDRGNKCQTQGTRHKKMRAELPLVVDIVLACQHCWLPGFEFAGLPALLATRFWVCWFASIAGYQIPSYWLLGLEFAGLPALLATRFWVVIFWCASIVGYQFNYNVVFFLGYYIYIYVSISVEGSNLLVQRANTYTNSSLWFPLKYNVEKSTPKTWTLYIYICIYICVCFQSTAIYNHMHTAIFNTITSQHVSGLAVGSNGLCRKMGASTVEQKRTGVTKDQRC